MLKRTLFCALALLAIGRSAADAQSIPSPFRFIEEKNAGSIFAGYLSTDRGTRDLGPHSGPIFGGTYAIHFGGPVYGEAALSGISSARTIFEPVSAGDSISLEEIGETSAFIMLVEAGLRLQLTGERAWRGLVPYLAATGGFATDLAGSPEEEEPLDASDRVEFGPTFTVRAAVGTDVFLTPRLTGRVEASDRIWAVVAPPGITGLNDDDSEWTNNLGLTLGLAYWF